MNKDTVTVTVTVLAANSLSIPHVGRLERAQRSTVTLPETEFFNIQSYLDELRDRGAIAYDAEWSEESDIARVVDQRVADKDPVASTIWEDLPRPIIIAHRGSGNIVAPENTMAAYRWAAGLGFVVEADLQYTADKAIICNHDETLDAPTGRTDGLTAGMLTLDAIRRLDFAQGYLPQLFSPQRPVTFEEYMELARAGVLLAPEVRGSTGEMGTDVARRIVRAGLQHMFLVQAFAAEELLAVKAVDPSIRTMRLGNISVGEAVANGYWAVCPEQTQLLNNLGGATYVNQMHAAGVKVFAYTVNYLKQAETLNDIGVDGYFSDDASHVATAGYRIPSGQTTTIQVPPIYSLSGWRWASSQAGAYPVTEDGFATFTNYAGFDANKVFKICVAGKRTADAPATQTIETQLKLVTAANPTRYVGLYFCWSTEYDGFSFAGSAAYGSSGYYFVHRASGGAEIVRVDNGAFTVLKTATWSAVADGQVIPITVQLTPTSITVSRSDTGQSISVDDATHPRGGFVRLLGSGAVPGIGDVTITY